MAVTKLKAYHSDTAVKNAVGYILNTDKTQLQDTSRFIDAKGMEIIENAMHYAENRLKTTYVAEDGKTEVLVSGHRCKVDLAKDTFKRLANNYYSNGHSEHAGKKYKVKTLLRAKLGSDGKPILDSNRNMIHDEKSPVYHDKNGDTITFLQERTTQVRTCYMWVMSFPPKRVCGYEIDPHLVHQIGKEFMAELEQAVGLEYAAVIATHIDKEHTHNHIVQCSYAMDGHHKYVDTMETLKLAREISDYLSHKYDLPIIFSPDNTKSISNEEWKLIQQGKSWKQTIRDEIAYNLERASSYEDFKVRMQRSGYTLRETENHLTYYTPGKTHRCRDVGLGTDYTKTSLLAYFEPEKGKQAPLAETLILPSKPDTYKPLTIYVSRYTASGRRRTDLEMLLLKAVKILKLIGDKFSEKDDTSTNPVYRSASWKITRLSEAISILDTRGIHTAKELDEQLLKTGAAYSHAKKDYNDIAPEKDGLTSLKDMLENLQELSAAMEDYNIQDFCLHPPTQREITEYRAKTFPMTLSQRKELYLALKKHPLYQFFTKYDSLTYMEAKECIDYLNGKSNIMPNVLATAFSHANNLDRKFDAIAGKVLSGIQSKLQGKPISSALKRELSSYSIPVNADTLSMADAIHLASYYRPWHPNYKPCFNPNTLVSAGKADQLKELLLHHGLEINIPVEQLSRKDASYLFQQLVLSHITPDIIKKSLEKSWQNEITQLTYEDRCIVEEYRELLQKVALLGYDAQNTDPLLADVNAQLDNIQSAEQKVKELAKEYKTLKQLKVYTTLADTTKGVAFTYGPKWQEQFQKKVEIEETIQPAAPEPDEIPTTNKRHFNVEVDIEF